MSRPEPEREEKPAGPGACARWALRVVDSGIIRLQRLRARLSGTDEAPYDDRHDAKHGKEPPLATVESVPKPPSLLRRLLLWILLLAIGAGTGTFMAYRGFALRLAHQNEAVGRMQEAVDAAHAEDGRTTRLLDKLQRENADYRRDAREAQRELEETKRHVTELDAQIADLKLKAERRELEMEQQLHRTAAGRPVALPRPQAQKSARCAAESAGDVSECIEQYNR